MGIKCEIYRDSMQNFRRYGIPKAQLIIADVPYNVGNNFYGSSPMWYKSGDNKNGEANLQERRLSILTTISICMSISISVARCLRKSQKRKDRHRA